MSDSFRRKLLCERLEDRRLLAAVGTAGDLHLDDLDRDLDSTGTSSELHPGSVHGRIVNDLNGNGVRDFGEQGIAAVLVYSDLNFDGIPQDNEPRTRSMDDNPLTDFDETGHYWLENLQPGFHMIRQVVPAGFEQTFPTLLPGHLPPPWGDATAHVVFVPAGGIVEGIHFGNHRPLRSASIHGLKWQDVNGNGERDTNEPGLAGVLIYADSNRNGRLDPDELRTMTMEDDPTTSLDETGRYWIENLPAGEYLIREVVPAGYRQTFPLLSLGADGQPRDGAENTDDQFAEIRPELIEMELQAGEVFIAEVAMTVHPSIFVPIEVDVIAPTAEILVINLSGIQVNGGTGDTSVFEVLIIGDGAAHEFDLQLINPATGDFYGTVPVFINSSMRRGAHLVELAPGQVADGIDFGNQPLRRGSVHGRKWEDQNGNREHDPNEPGLAGVTIYSDLNHNGALDAGEPRTVTMRDDPVTDFDETGLYWLRRLNPGHHIIREVVPDGFVQTYPELLFLPADPEEIDAIFPPHPIPGFHQVFVEPGQAIDGVDFGNRRIRPGVVAGTKWEDLNGDGHRDADEAGLAGVKIYSDRNFNGQLDDDEPFTVTSKDNPDTSADEAGFYRLSLSPGFHRIREIVPDGYVQTFPEAPFVDAAIPVPYWHELQVAPGQVIDGLDFGNRPLRSAGVHGFKWEDVNGNGRRDDDEPGIAGVTIYSDLNFNGMWDRDEPFTRSREDNPDTIANERGRYVLDNLHAGEHFIREVIPDGFVQTFPGSPVFNSLVPGNGFHHLFLESGDVVDGVDFGNQELIGGQVHGVKWEDLNGNSLRDPGEPGIAGVTIYSDLNSNGVLDKGEPFTMTIDDPRESLPNDTGKYRLNNLRPGVHLIREVVPDGFQQTFPHPVVIASEADVSIFPLPPGGTHEVILRNGEIVEGVDFGNQRISPASVHGVKWLDRNGNGQRDSSEPGLPGVIIYSDLNFNGVLDNNEPRTRSMEDNPVTDFDESGMYWLDNLRPGGHFIREVVPKGFEPTFPLSDILILPPEPGGHFVILAAGQAVDGIDFGNRPTRPATVLGNVWHDSNRNGARDPDETGQPGVTVYSDLNFNGMLEDHEPSTVTIEQGPFFFDTAGDYELSGLRPGLHVIRIVVPAGAVQTFPSPLPGIPNADAHIVVLPSGAIVDGRNFGIRRVGSDGVTIGGDFDRDGIVGHSDYRLWKSTYGSRENLLADANGDGVVNSADYTTLRDNMGATLAVAPTDRVIVPEPSLVQSMTTATTEDSVTPSVAAATSSTSNATTASSTAVVSAALDGSLSRDQRSERGLRAARDDVFTRSDFRSTGSALDLRRLDLTAAFTRRLRQDRHAVPEPLGMETLQQDALPGLSTEKITPSARDAAWASW